MRVAAALFLSLSVLRAQEPEAVLEAARAAIASARYAFLITVDGDGQPQARLMEAFPPTADFIVWMGTRPDSRKVAQIRAHPRATLAYYDPAGPNYVSLLGAARIVDDPAVRRKWWREDWERHFPGGPEGKNFTLIEFRARRIELVSVTRGIASAPGTPGPAILDRRGSRWVPVR